MYRSPEHLERSRTSWLGILNSRLNINEDWLIEKRQDYLDQKNEAKKKIACAKENTTIDCNTELEKVNLYEQEIKEIEDGLALISSFRNSLQSPKTLHELFDMDTALSKAMKKLESDERDDEMDDETVVKLLSQIKQHEKQKEEWPESLKEQLKNFVKY